MTDDSRDVRAVQVAGDEDGGVGVGCSRRESTSSRRLPVDTAVGVDLVGGQLRGLLHRQPDRIAERARDADPHDVSGAPLATAEQRGGEEQRAESGRK